MQFSQIKLVNFGRIEYDELIYGNISKFLSNIQAREATTQF